MSKKPTSNRLDKIFEDIKQEPAVAPKKPARKAPTRITETKSSALRATARSNTMPLNPEAGPSARAPLSAQNITVTQSSLAGQPASMSLAFQMDNENWATLQVVDDVAPRIWDENEQLLVQQVTDQLSLALENARLFQETRLRAEELSILNELGRELTSLLDQDAIGETVYKFTSRLMDTTNLYIALYDEPREEINPFYVMNNRARVQVPPRKYGQGLTEYVLKTRKPVLIANNVLTHMRELGIEVVLLGDAEMPACWIGTPLVAGDLALGVIGLQSLDTPNLYTPRHLELLNAVAGQAALALQNAGSFKEVQARAEEQVVLNRLGRVLAAQINVDQVLTEIYNGVSQLLDAKNFFIGLYDEESNTVSFPLNATESAVDREVVTIQADQGMTGYILRNKEPLLVADNLDEWMQDHDIAVIGEPAKSWLGTPLILGERVLGLMAVQNYTKPHNYNEHDRDIMLAFANQAAIAIQNARLFQETRYNAAIENLISQISSTFVNVDSNQMDDQITLALKKIGEFSQVDRTYLFEFSPDGQTMDNTHEWTGPDIESYINDFHNVPTNTLPFILDQIQKMQVVHFPRVSAMPDEAAQDRAELMRERIQSILCVPIVIQGAAYGFIGLDSVNQPKAWAEQDINMLRIVGEIFISTLGRKKVESALQKSEADLRTLFASMQDVVLVVDKDTRYLRIAPTNPGRLVRPPEELLGKTMQEVMPKETYENFQRAVDQALASDELVQIEYKLDIANQEYWFLANISRINADEVFWVARDITARKRDEEILQRRNDYLAATAEIGRLVTSTLDLPTLFSRTVNLVRDRFGFYHAGIFITEETGFSSVLQAATGAAGAEMRSRVHSLPVGSRSIVGEVTETGRPVVVNDTRLSDVHKPNPLLPDTLAEAAIPLRIGSRTIGALDIQSVNADAFTENDIAVLQTLGDQVAIAIDNARSYELSIQAVKEMREADKLKSQFLANMSHELRTPLNSIIGFSRVILKGIDGPTTDLQQQDLLAIHNSGQHLLGLINDILDLSRIEAGKMELTFDEVNLPELINGVISTASGLIKDKPITIQRDVSPDLPPVRADAMRIRQVLLNLLSNATKFTESGTITVKTTPSVNSSGNTEITISVTDTGSGIALEDQKKLFQPFSQVDASLTRRSGGSGLGLSISNHLVQMHGGQIGVQSAPGAGSTFFFSLPAHRSRVESAGTSANRIVLAIDDDPQVISLYERYLHLQGYQVIPLSDPSRAVERARQLKPFAITLDIMMPGYDGWRVLNDLKTAPETRDIPVVICSIVEDHERAFSLGASDYLIKPILEDDLLKTLERLDSDGSIREVLVIDDDPNDLRLIQRMLTEHGRYHPVTVEGGKNGWEAILARPPHAIIIDLFMPDMDGFALLEKLRTSEAYRNIPVIIVSGADLTPEQSRQLQNFGQNMLQKNTLTERQLIDDLERVLKRASRQAR